MSFRENFTPRNSLAIRYKKKLIASNTRWSLLSYIVSWRCQFKVQEIFIVPVSHPPPPPPSVYAHTHANRVTAMDHFSSLLLCQPLSTGRESLSSGPRTSMWSLTMDTRRTELPSGGWAECACDLV